MSSRERHWTELSPASSERPSEKANGGKVSSKARYPPTSRGASYHRAVGLVASHGGSRAQATAQDPSPPNSSQHLTWRPLLSAMQDAKHPDFTLGLKDLVDRNEWERRESDLSGILHAADAPKLR